MRVVITGIRRCGKSTLAKLAVNHLIDTGVDPKNILYVNLEQPSFLEVRHDPSYLQTIYDTYFPQSENKPCRLVIYEGNESADGVDIVSFGEFLLPSVS